MAQCDAQMGVQSRVAAGSDVFLVLLADADEPRVLIVHFFQPLLRAAVGIDTGADGFHVRQTRL